MSRIEEEINENTHRRAKECQRRKEKGKGKKENTVT